MADYEDAYSLFFTGIVVLVLFITVYNIVENLEEFYRLNSENSVLVSEIINYSKVISAKELGDNYYINLETNESFNEAVLFSSAAMPCLLMGESLSVCEVRIGE